MILSKTDQIALDKNDSNHFLNKGANLYTKEQYEDAVEYYHLAATMGNNRAASNLGYCYLYGRHCEKNPSLAIAYFKLADERSDDDQVEEASYKLGDIYEKGEFVEKDDELAYYYYDRAIRKINRWDDEAYESNPSLCYAVARAIMPEGIGPTDIKEAYRLLKFARTGYENNIENGFKPHEEYLERVKALLENPIFAEYIEEDHKREEEAANTKAEDSEEDD